MKTLFRASVMLSLLGAAGWALVEYGAAGAVRPFTTQAIEMADRMIGRPGAGTSPASIPIANIVPQTVPQLQMASQTHSPIGNTSPSSNFSPSNYAGRVSSQERPLASSLTTSGMGQLRGLGAREVAVAPWGSSGQLHRVCCEVPLANVRGMTQHFEAVAASPEKAASLLLTEIRTWQAARGSLAAQ